MKDTVEYFLKKEDGLPHHSYGVGGSKSRQQESRHKMTYIGRLLPKWHPMARQAKHQKRSTAKIPS